MPVLQDDLNVWFNLPVTEEFFRVIRNRQREIHEERLFFEGEPHRTQDAMSWRNGAGDMLQEQLDMKEAKTIYFDGEVYERIGDIPKGSARSG